MSQTVNDLIDQCINLLIASTGKLSDSPDLVLRTGTNNFIFNINKQDEDNYYNIMYNNSVVGGLKQEDDGRIRGKINLSDVSDVGTCIITQLSDVNNVLLLQPVRPKQKYDPKKTNFITKNQFYNED